MWGVEDDIEEEDDDDINSSDEEEDEQDDDIEDAPFITRFVMSRGNEFFCEVDRDFILDGFNMTGLSLLFEDYAEALDFILDENMTLFISLSERLQTKIMDEAEALYGLIHARFILTQRGLKIMYEKFIRGDFGTCPRFLCEYQHVLPVGESTQYKVGRVKLFCPKCEEIYAPPLSMHKNLDGSFIGPTFPHLFLMQFPKLLPSLPKRDSIQCPALYLFQSEGRKYPLNLELPQIQQSSINSNEKVDDKVVQDKEQQIITSQQQQPLQSILQTDQVTHPSWKTHGLKYTPKPFGFRFFTGSHRELQEFLESKAKAQVKLLNLKESRIQPYYKDDQKQEQIQIQAQSQVQQSSQSSSTASNETEMQLQEKQQQLNQQQQQQQLQPQVIDEQELIKLSYFARRKITKQYDDEDQKSNDGKNEQKQSINANVGTKGRGSGIKPKQDKL
ncbi:MAG: putative Casein kinase II subunit beta-1 [Streblomastix strix]|uniref:Casein kinase II subunit beta n=1 Tax=Streblomastix strix TaxID=222440 RepID=A0A5J4VL68_9EUKA|nr:MAG: putative Casein kinase II subunit beta-1 [Streblomastix strix]